MRISDWSSDVCSSDLFRPFAGDEFSECQVCLCEPRLVRLKRPRHSPRRLLVDGNACCGIKAGDLLLTALPIDDRRGLDRKSDVEGKRGSVRADLGGRRIMKKKTAHTHSLELI